MTDRSRDFSDFAIFATLATFDGIRNYVNGAAWKLGDHLGPVMVHAIGLAGSDGLMRSQLLDLFPHPGRRYLDNALDHVHNCGKVWARREWRFNQRGGVSTQVVYRLATTPEEVQVAQGQAALKPEAMRVKETTRDERRALWRARSEEEKEKERQERREAAEREE